MSNRGLFSTPGEWVYADPVEAAGLKTGFRASARQAEASSASREQIHHHGHAHTVRRLKRGGEQNERASASGRSRVAINAISFHAFLWRLSLLRPLISRFHAIHPVA